MKLHKVALWNIREMYYILHSKLVLDMTGLKPDLRISYLGSGKSLQDRLKNCSLLQKQ